MRDGGGNCLEYLKRGWNRKEGRGHKDYKKEGQVGEVGGARTPLRTMATEDLSWPHFDDQPRVQEK